jgi:glyoxylase-like metal-dependent hydrolase (beta-lactamase superfamily II)
MSTPAVAVAAGIWRIPTAPFDGINSYALVDDDGSVTLVDTGVSRAPARIVAGLAAIGKAPSDVTRILLTHAHFDHAGGVSRMRELTGGSVALHPDDDERARSGTGSPGDPARGLGGLLRRVPLLRYTPFESDEPLQDGKVLDVAGGLRVVHTPGHTAGHVSFLHEDSGVLITGDSVWNVTGVRRFPGRLCLSAAQNRTSAALLAELPFSIAAFTHGPHVVDRAHERVAAASRR